MKIGYARVSTEDQNPDLQLAALKDNGNDSSKILIHPANPLNDLQRRLLNPLENYPSNSLKMKYSKFPFSVFTKLQFGEQHSG